MKRTILNGLALTALLIGASTLVTGNASAQIVTGPAIAGQQAGTDGSDEYGYGSDGYGY